MGQHKILGLYVLMIRFYNPNMEIGSKELDQVLTALDRQMGLEGRESISLVVIGGAALHALGLISRTTKDVDVLGELEIGYAQIAERL